MRQHFIPLFSAPVTFKDDKPNFGTHVFTALEKDDARLAYAESVVATKALVDSAGMAGVLNLLSFIGEGMPLAQAFERATFGSYAEFQKTWMDKSR